MDDLFLIAGVGLVAYALYVEWGTGTALDLSNYFGGGGGDAGADGGDVAPVSSTSTSGNYSASDLLSLAQQTLAEMGITDITPQMAAAIALNESSGNPGATRTEPSGVTSYGLMQVLSTTAAWLYSIGYNAIAATPANLLTPEGSMYFGCAYLHWLRNYDSTTQSDAFVVAAYNGGPGGASNPGPQNYLAAWEQNMSNNGWA